MTLLTPDDHLTAEAWAAKALAAQALPQNTGSPKELKKKIQQRYFVSRVGTGMCMFLSRIFLNKYRVILNFHE